MVRGSDILLILVALLFPPATAFFLTGCSCDTLINVCLTILGYIPGHLHAFWMIWRKMEADEKYGDGGYRYIGNATYEPISSHPPPQPQYGATSQGRYAPPAPQQHQAPPQQQHHQQQYQAPPGPPSGPPPSYSKTR